MEYTIVQRNIGRAGTKAQIAEKEKMLNEKYGEGNWLTGYEINGQFHTRESAIQEIFTPSYFDFLDRNPKWVEELKKSGGVFNPHAEFSKSIDLQAVAVDAYMTERGFVYEGEGLLPIGSYQPKFNKEKVFAMAREKGLRVTDKILYPPISYALTPFKVPCIVRPSMSIEDFWQSEAKVLAVLTHVLTPPEQKEFQTEIGNIFDLVEDGDVVCITTNGEVKSDGSAVMGKGFAKEVALRFKEVNIDKKLGTLLKEYGNRAFKLGSYQYGSKKITLVSFPTKNSWRDSSQLDLIERSSMQLIELADKFNFKKIWLPMPGAGAGGLSWSSIKPTLSKLDERFVVITNQAADFEK